LDTSFDNLFVSNVKASCKNIHKACLALDLAAVVFLTMVVEREGVNDFAAVSSINRFHWVYE
jgi:hypothetical protein